MADAPWIEDASLLPAWLPEASRDALLGTPAPSPAALVALGRLLRAALLPGGARKRLQARLAESAPGGASAALREAIDHRASAVLTWIEALAAQETPAKTFDALAARDDLESLAWSLGLMDAGPLEASVLAEATRLDQAAAACQDLAAAAVRHAGGPPPWLVAVSRQSPGVWWARLVLLHGAREALTQWLTRPLVARDLAPLGLPLAAPAAAPALHFGGQARSEPEAILAEPLGPPVAALFDGQVLVHAHGLADHDAGAPPGLIVRHAEGRFEAIEDVHLEPPPPALPHRSALALAWWVPLDGGVPAPGTLVVTVATARGEERERLPLERLVADTDDA